MTLIAPHITAFLQQRLPVERRASVNTCDSYAYAFKLLFTYASRRLKVPPSQLHLEQLDPDLIVGFLNYLETERHNGPSSRNTRLAAIKSFMHFVEYRVPTALEHIRRVLAVPSKKADARLVKHLTIEEMQCILDALFLTNVTEFAIAPCCIYVSLQDYASRNSSDCGLTTYNLDRTRAFLFTERDGGSVAYHSGEKRHQPYARGWQSEARCRFLNCS